MAIKFDKDLLLKHKFWVVLGVAVPLSLAALFLLSTSIPAKVAGEKKKLEGALKKLAQAPKVAARDITAANVQAQTEKLKETVAWHESYKLQQALFRWPDEVEATFDFMNGLFAYEIAVEKAKEGDTAPPPAPKADEPKDKVEEDPNPLQGTLETHHVDYLIVKGDNGKTYKFRRTKNIKITGDKTFYLDIERGSRVTVSYNKGKYFIHDFLTDSEQAEYVRQGVYQSQIDAILRQVDPMRRDGTGVVQLRGWPYEPGKRPPGEAPFFQHLYGGWVDVNRDISEEAWLAQEELWIQKELFRLIRLANDSVSVFSGDLDDENEQGPAARKFAPGKVYNLKNPYWDMTLKWDGKTKLNITLKNLVNRRQKLDDLKFRIRFHKKLEPDIIRLDGPPLKPRGVEGDSVSRIITLPETSLRSGIYGVEQVLTWESAAVKRLDQIVIGSGEAHSHRTYPEGVVFYKRDEAGVPGAPPPVVDPKLAGKQQDLRTGHGFLRKRYMEPTDEARRLPIALTLIADQDHVDRVETAFENSKLRFLITQVLLNRYGPSVRPNFVVEEKSGGDKQPQFKPPDFKGGMHVPAEAATSGGEMESNVEMVIYGVITIYERFPPPKNKAPGAPK